MSESTKKETEDTKDIVAILLDNVRKYSLYGIFPLVISVIVWLIVVDLFRLWELNTYVFFSLYVIIVAIIIGVNLSTNDDWERER